MAEFRIRGVATNIPFLQAVLDDPDFRAGRVTTSFIEQRPHLLTARHSADRGTKLLTYLADVTVNKPHGERPELIDPVEQAARRCRDGEPPAGSRQRLVELGPEGFARWLRESPTIGVTDTTFRDAHQSLLATRVRTKDLLAVAPVVARTLPELLSLECWGGATYDVALRFLAEDPWERLAALREAVPNICLQMLLRGRNTVGYTPYPTEVTDAFVAGGRGHRHRHLPDLRRAQRRRADAARHRRRPGDGHGGRRGRPVLHLRPVRPGRAALHPRLLPPAGRADRRGGRPRPGRQGHGGPAARPGRRDARHRRCAASSTCRCTCTPTTPRAASSPPTSPRSRRRGRGGRRGGLHGGHHLAAVAVGASSPRPTTPSGPPGSTCEAVGDLEPYWESVRKIYAPFEAGLASPTGRVYHHEIPGGQLSNLRTQAVALGLGDRFEDIEAMYAAADRILGRLVKVTPSSKVVGDLALHLVGAGVVAGGLRGRTRQVRHPRLRHRLPARRAGQPARRLAGAVPHQGAGGPRRAQAGGRN